MGLESVSLGSDVQRCESTNLESTSYETRLPWPTLEASVLMFFVCKSQPDRKMRRGCTPELVVWCQRGDGMVAPGVSILQLVFALLIKNTSLHEPVVNLKMMGTGRI